MQCVVTKDEKTGKEGVAGWHGPTLSSLVIPQGVKTVHYPHRLVSLEEAWEIGFWDTSRYRDPKLKKLYDKEVPLN